MVPSGTFQTRASVTSGNAMTTMERRPPRRNGSSRPPMIKTRPGGMSRLAVIVGIRSLQDRPQRLGEDDEHDAGKESEPGAKPEPAIEVEIRVMRDHEVQGDKRLPGPRRKRPTEAVSSRAAPTNDPAQVRPCFTFPASIWRAPGERPAARRARASRSPLRSGRERSAKAPHRGHAARRAGCRRARGEMPSPRWVGSSPR